MVRFKNILKPNIDNIDTVRLYRERATLSHQSESNDSCINYHQSSTFLSSKLFTLRGLQRKKHD